MKLVFEKPAGKWEQTLPIGNGSLGAMIWGGTSEELIGFNYDRLWSGYRHDKNNIEAKKYLEPARRLIEQGRYTEAESLIRDHMLGEYGENYLPLGRLKIKSSSKGHIADYRRELDISRSLARISYRCNGHMYEREFFASFPAKAIIICYKCDVNEMSLDIKFESELKYSLDIRDDLISIYGQCPEHSDPNYVNSKEPVIQGTRGMKFDAGIRILECDGACKSADYGISINKASRVVIAFDASKEPDSFGLEHEYENSHSETNNEHGDGTCYDESKKIHQNDICYDEPKKEHRYKISYDDLKREHIDDYKSIFDKVELYLGEQPDIPTDERLKLLREGTEDPALFALYFQYCRYLLISSSREGSMPANLQGIWSWELRSPWSSNFTSNINLEMNYWPSESCNLQECLKPYFDLLKKVSIEGHKTAEINYGCRGFVAHHNLDYWCNTNPMGIAHGDSKGEGLCVMWSFWPMGGAWLTSELYRYYEYNEDIDFLQKTAYPILKEGCLFLLDWIYEYKDQYVSCPSTSPENRFVTKDGEASVCMNSAMDMTLIREVFHNFQKTCKALDIDDEILPQIRERLSRLAPVKVGRNGQILEWNEEFVETDKGHRHLSSIYGLFPSEEFESDPRLKEAALRTLKIRMDNGSGQTGWSCAWIMNLLAIAGDGDKAYQYALKLLCNATHDNLWGDHPPYQIDANFGAAAAIANMLVQDRNGEVKLLPALPKAWKKGYVKGLRIKHNLWVDIEWEDGKIINKKIYRP